MQEQSQVRFIKPKKMQELEEKSERRDVDGFTDDLKNIAYALEGVDIADQILPYLESLFPVLDASVIELMLKSAEPLNFYPFLGFR